MMRLTRGMLRSFLPRIILNQRTKVRDSERERERKRERESERAGKGDERRERARERERERAREKARERKRASVFFSGRGRQTRCALVSGGRRGV